MSTAIMPRQDIPEKDKNLEWFKKHMDYAEQVLTNRRAVIDKANRLYDSYNGKTEAESIRHLVSTYGKKNRSKYISYRLSKTKLDILVGEFLKMPLNATVKTINSSAVTEKTRKYELALAAMHAQEPLQKLLKVGVDVMEGAQVPKDKTEFQAMSFKDKNESVMQIMLNEFKKEFRLQQKFGVNLQDCTITSRAFGRVTVNEVSGEMDYETYDSRDIIVVEYDRDPFYEKTPVFGSIQKMPIHKILTTFKLTKEERDRLDAIRMNPSNYLNNSEYRGRYSYQEGEFCADVIHMEWKSVSPKYSKSVAKTEDELFIDDSETMKTVDLSATEYESNPDAHDNVTTEWEEELMECVRIGHDIIPKHYQRRKPFTMKDEDTGKILGFSYIGMVFNKVDGDVVSLKEVCDNFDTLFDTLMYQILKEINKAKGKVIVYDRAGLPKKTTIKNVLYNALNDSFLDIDSSAAGNMSGQNLTINQIFKEIDLGVSSSFPFMIQMKNEIKRELDDITGINSAREGGAPASSTVANNMQNLESSRTITEPMFYYMTKFCEKVMLTLVETGKLVWGLYQPNKAKMILGDERYAFMQATSKIAWASYMVELVNPRWEQAIMERMRQMADVSLNAKEIRPIDVIDLEMQETLADKRAMLRRAWEEIEGSRRQTTEMQIKADAENKQRALDTQVNLMAADREDRQQSDKDKIILKGEMDIKRDAAKQKGQMFVDKNKSDDQLLNNQSNL